MSHDLQITLETKKSDYKSQYFLQTITSLLGIVLRSFNPFFGFLLSDFVRLFVMVPTVLPDKDVFDFFDFPFWGSPWLYINKGLLKFHKYLFRSFYVPRGNSFICRTYRIFTCFRHFPLSCIEMLFSLLNKIIRRLLLYLEKKKL